MEGKEHLPVMYSTLANHWSIERTVKAAALVDVVNLGWYCKNLKASSTVAVVSQIVLAQVSWNTSQSVSIFSHYLSVSSE